jgi:uncharacterized protein (DUF427 family)
MAARTHDITLEQGDKRVVILKDGQILAESERPLFLHETGMPTRIYIPAEDIVAEVEPSTRRTNCPFKGDASYYSVGGHEDIAWFYPEPIDGMEQIKGLVAFYNERVDFWEKV